MAGQSEADIDTNASCPHPKGSKEQLDWLMLRLERGQSLFHVGDNPEHKRRPDCDGTKILDFLKKSVTMKARS